MNIDIITHGNIKIVTTHEGKHIVRNGRSIRLPMYAQAEVVKLINHGKSAEEAYNTVYDQLNGQKV